MTIWQNEPIGSSCLPNSDFGRDRIIEYPFEVCVAPRVRRLISMRKGSLFAAAVLGALLVFPRAARKRARLPARPKRARWREQLDAFASNRWQARAPAWAVPLVDEAARKTDVPAVLLAA